MAEIHHQFQIAAPVPAVFDAFTTPKGLDSWWTLQSEGQPVRDSLYRLYFGPEYDWKARVLNAEINRSLTWSIVQAMADWMPTSFGFTLSPKGQSTSVRFFHIGWETANEHFAITNFCWGQLLNGLKNYVENGFVVPFENRN